MHTVQYNRKTNLKVKGGKVQKKNNHLPTFKRGFVVERESPRKGFNHLVTKNEVLKFIQILPDWRNLIDGIECIRLSSYSDTSDASYQHYRRDKTGIIELSAWESDLIQNISTDYFNAHKSIFEKIELKFEVRKDGVLCWFDDAKAKAFLLVHIFLHELGHHIDRMKKSRSSSGEPFAENFANRLEDEVWPEYVRIFGKP